MSILFWGLTTGTIGKVLLALGVLTAHSKIADEHKIDRAVLKSFRIERVMTILGLFLIVVGYGMEVYFYGFTTFLTCDTAECTAAISAAFSQ